jgi:hypothetical protein
MDPIFDEARLRAIAAARHLVVVLEEQPERIRDLGAATADVGAAIHALADAVPLEARRLVA